MAAPAKYVCVECGKEFKPYRDEDNILQMFFCKECHEKVVKN